MKKILSIVLTIIFTVAMFAYCGTAASNKLGTGLVLTYMETQRGSVYYEATAAAVVLDSEGKIVNCRFDSLTSRVSIGMGNAQDGAQDMTFKSLYDLANEYTFGRDVALWYKSADTFAAYCVGKTAQEVGNIPVDESGMTTDMDLFEECDIEIDECIKAIVKACNDAKATPIKDASDIKLGLYLGSKVNSVNNATANDGNISYLIDCAVTAVNADGTVAVAVVDAAKPEFKFNNEGTVIESKYDGSEREQNILNETFCDSVKGKNAEEISKLTVSQEDETNIKNIVTAINKTK